MSETRESDRSTILDVPVGEVVQAYVATHQEALCARGFKSLALFGSCARGEAGPESDVDVLYEFAHGHASLDAVLDLQEALEHGTGRKVHLVSRRHLHPILRERVLEEAVDLLPLHSNVA